MNRRQQSLTATTMGNNIKVARQTYIIQSWDKTGLLLYRTHDTGDILTYDETHSMQCKID